MKKESMAAFAARGLLLAVLLLFCSCGALDALKADPAPPAGFIEHPEELQPWPERAAFLQKIWFKDRAELYRTRDKYKKIFFKPTRSDFIHARGWWSELNSLDKKGYVEDVDYMARYIDRALVAAVKDDPKKRFELADWPDAETFCYEFAITELVPTKVAVNVAGTALGALVPGGGLVKVTGKGSIAVEVIGFDGATGEILIKWTDRKLDQSSLFSVNDFTPYEHAKKVADSWAEDLVEAWNTSDTHKIDGLSPFTLSPF